MPVHATVSSGACWECSKRRLVCDCARPACRKCLSRGKDCPGYDHKPLKWMQPGQTRSKGARAAARLRPSASPASAASTSAVSTVPSRAGPAEDDDNDDDDDEETRSVDRRNDLQVDQAVAIQTSVRDKSTFGLLVQAVEYYNITVAPELLGTGVGGETNPFFIPSHYVNWMPPALAQTIICTALGHRIFQTVEGFEEQRSSMAVALQNHRGDAIRYLTSELVNCRDETLVSILSLLLCEIQHSLSPNWWHHVDGAYTVIDLHGGLSHSLKTRPLRYLYRYFLYVDIFGTTTTPVVAPHQARRQLDVLDVIEELCDDGSLTCVPCSPKLLAEIIFINHHRSAVHGRTRLLPDGTDGSPDGSKILERILAFSPELWASKVRRRAASEANAAADGNLPSPPADEWDWVRMARTYHSAVALYCMASLPGSTSGYDQELELWKTFRDSLLRDLKETSADPGCHLRKLVLWPMTILGISVDDDDETTQRFIRSELDWASYTLGTASPLVAKHVLERIWRSSLGGRGVRWESLFDRPYVFGL